MQSRALLTMSLTFIAVSSPQADEVSYYTPKEVSALVADAQSKINKLMADGAGGQIISSSAFPAVGMLVVGSEFCSASAISQTEIITAAHCLCADMDAAACQKNAASLSAYFYSPSDGVRHVSAKTIKIDPSYWAYAHQQVDLKHKVSVNDAAVAALDQPVSNFVRMGVADSKDKSAQYYQVSFGYAMSWSGSGPDNEAPLEVDRRYQPGVPQTVLFRELRQAAGCSFADVLCVATSGFPTNDPQLAEAGACNGDSGGPLYQVTSQGLFLVGLAIGGSEAAQCRSTEGSVQTLFLDIAAHQDFLKPWLQSPEPKGAATALSSTCHDVLFDTPFDIKIDRSVAKSVSVVPVLEDKSAEEARPAVRAELSGSAHCDTTGDPLAAQYCRLNADDAAIIFHADEGTEAVRFCN